MMYGFYVCNDARNMLSNARTLAAMVTSTSVECPEALERNRDWLLKVLEEAREALAAIESKLETVDGKAKTGEHAGAHG